MPRSSTDSMIIHGLLCPKISHCHQRHLHTSISCSSSRSFWLLLTFLGTPVSCLVFFREKLLEWWKHRFESVQSVQAQLAAARRPRLIVWDELLVNGRSALTHGTWPSQFQWHRQRLERLVSCLSQLRAPGASGSEGRDAARGAAADGRKPMRVFSKMNRCRRALNSTICFCTAPRVQLWIAW